jgi:hypothetical protein
MRRNFFSYLRASTDKHGEHGYGIAAQRQAVKGYLNGGTGGRRSTKLGRP